MKPTDVCNRVPFSCRSSTLLLVELVVQYKVFLVLSVENPPLVGVRGTLVRNAGDHLQCVLASHPKAVDWWAYRGGRLVCDIIDGKTVLVVSVADITALVSGVWATVYETLGIVNVTVLRRASRSCGVGLYMNQYVLLS